MDLTLLNLYKEELKLEVAEVQVFMGIVCIPWSFKIFYGFMSDNVSILGSKRRVHVLMNTACCMVAMMSIILFGNSWGKYFVTFCVLVSQINMAYNDTVTDAMTVQASKSGVEDGTENLNAICYFMQAVGAIAGAFMSMFAQSSKTLDPYDCFGIYMGL